MNPLWGFLCAVCMFSPGAPTSSQSPKTCILGDSKVVEFQVEYADRSGLENVLHRSRKYLKSVVQGFCVLISEEVIWSPLLQ